MADVGHVLNLPLSSGFVRVTSVDVLGHYKLRLGFSDGSTRDVAMIGLTPDIIKAGVPRHGVLRLTFADGVTGEVYVLDRMRGPVFERAVTPEGFAEVSADFESGTVCWPGGADLAPDTLYERVRTGVWPGQIQAA